MPKHTQKPKTKSATPLQQMVRQSSATKLFYASLGMLIIAIALLVSALVVQQRMWAQQTEPAPRSGFPVGVQVSHGQVAMEVKRVVSSGEQPGFAAPKGTHYVIVTLWVKNKSDQPINVFPTTDTYVKSVDGVVSYLTPYGLKAPFHAGAILPGESVEGELSYLTSSSAQLKFYVDAIWSGGVVPFRIQ